MFVKPPEGFEDCFGFVYDFESFNLGLAEGGWGEGTSKYLGVILVSKKVALEVERIIGQILGLKKINLLDKYAVKNEGVLPPKLGTIIEKIIGQLHLGNINLGDEINSYEDLPHSIIPGWAFKKEKDCPEFCICQFKFGKKKTERERIWGHHIYHLLLRRCAKEIGITYNNLVSSYAEYKNITISKVSEYLSVNDWDIKNGIAEEKGAVGFILISYLKNYKESLRIGNIEHLEEKDLIKRNLFKDCMKDKCKYDGQYTLWESKSTIQTDNKLPIEKGMQIPAAWIPEIEKNAVQKEPIPMAIIRQNDCLCSVDKYYYGLYMKEFVEGEIKEKCIKHFKDYKSEDDKNKIPKDKYQYDALIFEFYSRFLPKKQAELVPKLIRRETMEDKERHSKFLLRKTLENVVSHWPDIKHLSEQISKPKSSKKKGGDSNG